MTSMEFGPSFGRMSVEAARAKRDIARAGQRASKEARSGKGVLFAIDEAQSRQSRNWRLLPPHQQVLGDQDATGLPIATSAVLRWYLPACPVWLTTCSKSRA